MISLHVTIYNTGDGEGDRFKVMSPDPTDVENLIDVTDQYELTAVETETGRGGFAVFKLEEN